jgi:histidinol dehydrogenase
MKIRKLHPSDKNYARAIDRLLLALRGAAVVSGDDRSGAKVADIVSQIIADVSQRGDAALVELTRRIDGVKLSPRGIRVPAGAIASAHRQADPAFLALVRRVAANIRRYQRHILHRAPRPLKAGGRRLGVRYTPLDRVGVYVPGLRAMYPSTVLMTVVPAQVAGVGQVAICSPPVSGGEVNPMVLALAGELGITEVYRLGGAQAVAAMALGTKAVAAVDKIVGPGNAFVAEAKRQLFGRVGIDSIAGPSEVLIVADDSAPADFVAADMIAQAEHNPGSAILVTPSTRLAKAVADELPRQVSRLERSAAIAAALEGYSAIIVARNLADACAIANRFATEHLQIMVRRSGEAMKLIRHGGAIFIGQQTPVPLGDYYAGPSHVLPTGTTARFFSPLSCNDFLKASSLIEYDARTLRQDAADVMDFAAREGLTAHAAAVRKRLR